MGYANTALLLTHASSVQDLVCRNGPKKLQGSYNGVSEHSELRKNSNKRNIKFFVLFCFVFFFV